MTDVRPSDRLDTGPARFSNLAVFGLLLLSVVLIYGPAFVMPYTLLDDNWIIQSTGRWRDFTTQVVKVIQGRPLFAEFMFATGALGARIGIAAMGVVRALAAVCLAVAMYLIVRWVRACGVPRLIAVLFGLVLATLPAYQIYVTGGPWLTAALSMSVGAAHLIARASDQKISIYGRSALALAAGALVIAALAFYQATPMIVFAMLTWPVLTADLRQGAARERLARLLLTAGVVMAASITVYAVVWRFAVPYYYPDLGAFNYGPSSFRVATMLNHLRDLPVRRVPLVARLWSVMTTGADFTGGQLFDGYTLAIGVCIALGIIADIWRQRAAASWAAALGWTALRWLAVCGLLVLADTASILAPTPVNSFYMSSGPLTLAVLAILFQTTRSIAHATGPLADATVAVVLCAAAVFGAFRAQKMVLEHFVVPLNVEYRLVRGQIRSYAAAHELCGIRFVQNTAPVLGQGFSEYGWSNVNSLFYETRLTENVLDDLNLRRVHIDVVVPPATKPEVDLTQKEPKGAEGCQPAVVDMSGLSLR